MKKSIYYLYFLLTIFIFKHNSFLSQYSQHNCGQHIVLKELLKNNDFKAYYDQEQRALASNNQFALPKSGIVYKIPVVFHVVHNNGIEKIDRSQVLDALQKLNIDLRALRADSATVDSLFKPLIADIEVEFVAYNVVGAAQELHSLITSPLPYQGGAAGPIVDTQ